MYSSSNLIIYYDKDFENKENIHLSLIDCDISFKVFNSLKLIFSAIKNPQNYVIVAVNNLSTLHELENITSECFDYQNRLFVIFSSPNLIDKFFKNYCTFDQLNHLKIFIQSHIKNKSLIHQHQTSTLLNKLVSLELENLGIETKYTGFNYLVGAVVNAISKNFYANTYIDLFTNIASTNLESIDTVERDVRHLLRTTWKNNSTFRNIFNNAFNLGQCPKSKELLNAIIEYLKKII